MRAIGANAIRLWGYDSSVFKYVDLAHEEMRNSLWKLGNTTWRYSSSGIKLRKT
ncbi:hypothetical protein [Archaeoglobus sp.]